jgi:hypothetical protein
MFRAHLAPSACVDWSSLFRFPNPIGFAHRAATAVTLFGLSLLIPSSLRAAAENEAKAKPPGGATPATHEQIEEVRFDLSTLDLRNVESSDEVVVRYPGGVSSPGGAPSG